MMFGPRCLACYSCIQTRSLLRRIAFDSRLSLCLCAAIVQAQQWARCPAWRYRPARRLTAGK